MQSLYSLSEWQAAYKEYVRGDQALKEVWCYTKVLSSDSKERA
jgi:hypothetical protein